jgi:hypothetical protein
MLECPANYVRTPHRATHHPGGTPSPLGWPPGCASCLPAMRTPVLNPFAMAEHGSAPAVLCEAGTGEGRNAVGATSAGHEMAGRRTSLCQGMPAWNLASKRTSAKKLGPQSRPCPGGFWASNSLGKVGTFLDRSLQSFRQVKRKQALPEIEAC